MEGIQWNPQAATGSQSQRSSRGSHQPQELVDFALSLFGIKQVQGE